MILELKTSHHGPSDAMHNPSQLLRLLSKEITSLSQVRNESISKMRLASSVGLALDKIRFLSFTDKVVLVEGDNTKLEIQIKLDKENKILSIHDRAFVEKMQTCGDLNLIDLLVNLVVWEYKVDDAFVISENTYNEPLGRGTEIILHLREGEYLEESKLKVFEFKNFPHLHMGQQSKLRRVKKKKRKILTRSKMNKS
ncbi:endoplasmin [Tanacetum coccineum]